MIFKTTLKDINTTAVAIDKLNKITATIRNADPKDYTLYGAAIDSLNAKQLALALSTQNLSDEEMIGVFTKNELIKKYGAEELIKAGLLSTNSSLLTSEKAVNAEDIQQLLIKKGVNKEEAKEFIQKNLIVAANGEESVSTVLLNKALMAEAVERGILSEEKVAEILSTYGVVTADVTETASKRGLAKATWELVKSQAALLAANPVTWLVLGLVALVGVLDLVTTSTAEYDKELNSLRDNLENVKSECSELESELKSCNDELTTTQERIKELEKIESPTFVEKEEYNNLLATNNELERKIALLELEQKVKNAEKNKAFIDTMQKDVNDGNEYWINHDNGHIYKGDSFWAMFSGIRASNSTETDFIEQQFATRRRLLNELSEAETEEEKAKIQNSIDEIDSYLQSKSSEWTKDSEGINYISNPQSDDDRAVNEWLDYIADFQDRMAIAVSAGNAETNARYKTNTFNRLVDNWQFDDTVQELQDLGKEGKVTAEMLDDPKYEEFISKLAFLGVIDSADNLEDVALAFNSVAIAAENAADSAEKYTNKINLSSSISQLSTQLEPQFSKLGEAYNAIFTANGFTLDAVDNSMLEGLRKTFAEIEKGIGVTFDPAQLEPFFATLTDGGTEQEVQQAFNDLATAYLYSTGTLEQLNDETAIAIRKQLEQMGVTNAETVVAEALRVKDEELALSKKYLALEGKELAEATNSEVLAFMRQEVEADNCSNALVVLQLKKLLVNGTLLNTEADINNVMALAKAAGIATTSLSEFAVLKDEYENARENFNMAETEWDKGAALKDMADISARMKAAKEQFEDEVNNFSLDPIGIEFKTPDSSKSEASSSAAEQAEKNRKNVLDKETDLLEKQLAANVITFKEYTDKRRQIIEDYYRDGKIKAEEYYDSLESMYGSQLSLYDRVVNAVTNRIDDEIDKLKDQKEAIENSYQVRIDAIQEEIDALNKANDARQNQIDLEKAQYEAERARNQRVNKVYDGSQFVYAADMDAVRDAEEDLADKEFRLNISQLETQIELLKEEMENATKSLDNQIDALEAYKDKWNEISDVYQKQQDKLLAAEIMGSEWEQDILNGRLDTLRSFTEQYIALQQAQADAAVNAARIKAEAEAGNTTGGNVGSANTDGNGGTPKREPKYEVVYEGTAKTVQTFDKLLDAQNYVKRMNKSIADDDFMYYIKKYASGTDNARKGLNLVGEDGTETFIDNDGNVALVTKPTLIPMEGGEVVKNAEETKAMLDTKNLEPMQSEELKSLFERIRNMQPTDFNFQSITKPLETLISLPNIEFSPAFTTSEAVNIVQNNTINCPNVTNNSGAEYIMKELKRLPLDTIQFSHRRHK